MKFVETNGTVSDQSAILYTRLLNGTDKKYVNLDNQETFWSEQKEMSVNPEYLLQNAAKSL